MVYKNYMKNKKSIIIVIILLVIGGAFFYLTKTCNPPFIRGNISSTGEKIYHLPSGEYYDKTIIDKTRGERCFLSEKRAISAGWRASSR